MTQKTDRDEVGADLATVEALLAAVPDADVLVRRSLKARRDILAQELASLAAQAHSSAHAALYFGGAPVVGSHGIDATFASKALANYEDFVTKVWGQRQHGILPASGPVRDRHEPRLHITGIVRGSFGFELAELEGANSSEGAPLRDAVDLATRAIIAAGESDDALADAAEALDRRAFAALREFFTVLKKGGASVRVVTDDLDRSFDVSAVLAAAERTQGALTEEQDVPVLGEFLDSATSCNASLQSPLRSGPRTSEDLRELWTVTSSPFCCGTTCAASQAAATPRSPSRCRSIASIPWVCRPDSEAC